MKRYDIAINKTDTDRRDTSYLGLLSSNSKDGKTMSINNLNKSQLRDVANVAPFGISSKAPNGMMMQTIINDNKNYSALGVIDPNKPNVSSGEIMLYSIGGSKVYLSKSGSIRIENGASSIVMSSGGNITLSGGNIDIQCSQFRVNGTVVPTP